MKTRYLPAIASILIIAIAMTSFMPVFAALPTRLVAQPTLSVTTIAEDDEARETGMIVFGTSFTGSVTTGNLKFIGPSDLIAEYKILVSYNGVPVTPTTTSCQFVEKDKVNPLKGQFPPETLVSVPTETQNFICKFRWGKPGVGVIDVYFTGVFLPQYIADYIIKVSAGLAVGRTTVTGSEIQDVCVIGAPLAVGGGYYPLSKPDGTTHPIFPDPLDGYVSCEDAALAQRAQMGLTIQGSYT